MLATAGLVALSAGCVGEIGDRAGESSSNGPLGCDANTRPSATDLRRLTAEQYRNAVTDLFAPVTGIDVPLVAAEALSRLPADGTQT